MKKIIAICMTVVLIPIVSVAYQRTSNKRSSETSPKERVKKSPGYTCDIEMLSEPPSGGAAVKINGNYIGKTPLIQTIRCTKDGRFLGDSIFWVHIVAMPTKSGCEQMESFRGGSEVPRKMMFIMDLCPSTKKIDVNVR